MSIILMAGKTCLACSDCEDESMKVDFQSTLYSQTSEALAEIAMLYDYGLIIYEDFVSFCSTVSALRLLCFRCEGDEQLVFHGIQAEIIPAIEKETKKNSLFIATKEESLAKGNIIRFDFAKRRLVEK